jgi:hypothetical protein
MISRSFDDRGNGSGLGQLLEYAFWPPGARVVSRLIVVGEPVMDNDSEKYLQLLKKRFSLPIEYQRIIVK